MPDAAELLAAYDAQLRAHVHDRLPDSVRVERDGPLVRTAGFGNRGFVEYRDLADRRRLEDEPALGVIGPPRRAKRRPGRSRGLFL